MCCNGKNNDSIVTFRRITQPSFNVAKNSQSFMFTLLDFVNQEFIRQKMKYQSFAMKVGYPYDYLNSVSFSTRAIFMPKANTLAIVHTFPPSNNVIKSWKDWIAVSNNLQLLDHGLQWTNTQIVCQYCGTRTLLQSLENVQ